MWGVSVVPIAPRTPGLIWVLGLVAGDEMVDWSLRRRRLRPLGLLPSSACQGRDSGSLRELVASLRIIGCWGRGGDRAEL